MERSTHHYMNRSNEHSSTGLDTLLDGCAPLGIHIEDRAREQFIQYQELLREWAPRVNLTSITDPLEIQRRHFLDSLTSVLAAGELLASTGTRLIDVGSGAGFPGIPLKLIFPNLRITLADSRGQRVEFLTALVTALELADVEVVAERAETLGQDPRYRECFDLAVARALADLPVALELCLPLVAVGGVVLLQRRGDAQADQAATAAALDELGGAWEEPIAITLPGLDDGRMIMRARKTRPTPPRYPRRPGMPNKRPLR